MSCRYCCKDKKYYESPKVDMTGRCVSCGWTIYSKPEMDRIRFIREVYMYAGLVTFVSFLLFWKFSYGM